MGSDKLYKPKFHPQKTPPYCLTVMGEAYICLACLITHKDLMGMSKVLFRKGSPRLLLRELAFILLSNIIRFNAIWFYLFHGC